MTIHRFKVDKLIRDKLPAMMRNDGLVVHECILEPDEFVSRLKDKLIEEAHEVYQAQDRAALALELADVVEVVYALAHVSGLSMEHIEQKRQEKRTQRGGFDGHVYCAFVEVESTNPIIEYYRSRADQFPEIEPK